MVAVRELEKERQDIRFEVLEASSARELMKEHMGDSGHGLMAYDGGGKLVEVIAGHRFAKKDIVAVLEKL